MQNVTGIGMREMIDGDGEDESEGETIEKKGRWVLDIIL